MPANEVINPDVKRKYMRTVLSDIQFVIFLVVSKETRMLILGHFSMLRYNSKLFPNAQQLTIKKSIKNIPHIISKNPTHHNKVQSVGKETFPLQAMWHGQYIQPVANIVHAFKQFSFIKEVVHCVSSASKSEDIQGMLGLD
ncbi:hypothetical protein AWENTII_012933 [Aspergillus wentii]